MKGDDRDAMLLRFGENAARFRRGLGLSQEALSFRAEVHRTQISLIERGERLTRTPTIVALAGALEVPVGSLFDGIDYDVRTGLFRVWPDDDWIDLHRPTAVRSRETGP
jgi:transcriptional regulator with XRE-family HTH domain